MSMSSRVLGAVDAVADGEDREAMSLVVDALIELVDDTELDGVVVIEEVVVAV